MPGSDQVVLGRLQTDRWCPPSVLRSEALVRVYNTGDLEALVETFYTEDASLLPPHQPRVWGRPQIHQCFQRLREVGMRELAAEILQLDVSGDLAYWKVSHRC